MTRVCLPCLSVSIVTTPTCSDKNEGRITPTISGGHPPFKEKILNMNQEEFAALGLASGDYRYILTDSKGCESAQSFTIATKRCAEHLAFNPLLENTLTFEAQKGKLVIQQQNGSVYFETTLNAYDHFNWDGKNSKGELVPGLYLFHIENQDETTPIWYDYLTEMKKLIYILLLTLPFCYVSGQTVKISDANFKACLMATLPHLFNAQQELILDSAKQYNGELTCSNWGIEQVPELIYFESITDLSLNKNKLTTLPSLDNLKQLKFFYVAENQLTAIPSVDSLKNLERFICWRNQLNDLPDLTHLHKLYRLDVPVNFLTKFPPLSPTAPLRTILVDDNLITDLPDLSGYPLLQIVKLVNNQLSFDDLDRILTQPNPAIYDYYPQKFFNVLTPQTVNEGDSLVLTTTLDQNNPAVDVKWFKGTTVLNDSSASTVIFPTTLADAGKYHASLHSTKFPNQPLYTNTTSVTVRECPNLSLVDYTLKNVSCTTPGQTTAYCS